MITDNSLRLFSSFSLANRSTGGHQVTSDGAAASASNTNLIDIGYLRDIGEGNDLYMVVTINGGTDILSITGAANIRFDALILSATGTAPNLVPDTSTLRWVGSSGQLLTNTTAAATTVKNGHIIAFRINPFGESGARVNGAGAYANRTTNLRQYLTVGLIVDTYATANIATQSCSIDIVTDIQSMYRSYPSGFTVA
jgi:hypothetical protein